MQRLQNHEYVRLKLIGFCSIPRTEPGGHWPAPLRSGDASDYETRTVDRRTSRLAVAAGVEQATARESRFHGNQPRQCTGYLDWMVSGKEPTSHRLRTIRQLLGNIETLRLFLYA
ncbi:hypothetical protein E4U24_003535 [Claviceps purpurea]|nr:hypothetical protein E4U24_003535 [Claviceps purpurea]